MAQARQLDLCDRHSAEIRGDDNPWHGNPHRFLRSAVWHALCSIPVVSCSQNLQDAYRLRQRWRRSDSPPAQPLVLEVCCLNGTIPVLQRRCF